MSRAPGPVPSVPVLSVADVSCGYGGAAVVLTGATGTGKSTVLRTAAGRQPAVSGERLLHGGPRGRLPLRLLLGATTPR